VGLQITSGTLFSRPFWHAYVTHLVVTPNPRLDLHLYSFNHSSAFHISLWWCFVPSYVTRSLFSWRYERCRWWWRWRSMRKPWRSYSLLLLCGGDGGDLRRGGYGGGGVAGLRRGGADGSSLLPWLPTPLFMPRRVLISPQYRPTDLGKVKGQSGADSVKKRRSSWGFCRLKPAVRPGCSHNNGHQTP
jgi:hypothetical protein